MIKTGLGTFYLHIENNMANARDLGKVLSEAITSTLESSFQEVDGLKPHQEEAVFNVIARRDVFAVLPTSWGKSLIFQIIPGVCSYLHNRGFPYPKAAITIVVCPLTSLVESHIRELDRRGIQSCSLSGKNLDEKELFVANPESLINNEKWRAMLQTEVYQANLFGLVTDEAHVVPKW